MNKTFKEYVNEDGTGTSASSVGASTSGSISGATTSSDIAPFATRLFGASKKKKKKNLKIKKKGDISQFRILLPVSEKK